MVIERDGVRYKRNVSCLKKVRSEFRLGQDSVTDRYSEQGSCDCCEDVDKTRDSNEEREAIGGDAQREIVEEQGHTAEEEQEPADTGEVREGEREGAGRPIRQRNKPLWHKAYDFT